MKSERLIPVIWLILSLVLVGSIPPSYSLAGAALQDQEAGLEAVITLIGKLPDDLLDAAGNIVVTGGLDNVAIGTYVLLEGGARGVGPEAISAYRWTLEKPPTSTASLSDPAARYVYFIPDVEGRYTVTLAVADLSGRYGPTTYKTITAGTWVGVGIFPDDRDHPAECDKCHSDQVALWQQTRHASSLAVAMDGQVSQYYLGHCIYCHTVGYNEAADNKGFDDVARELNWSYPEHLEVGNYQAFVAAYPRLANLGNTQCENCHGPGSQKSNGPDEIAVSLQPDLCVACHDPLRQDRYPQWQRSSHSDTSLALFPAGIDNPACASCHTTEGVIASLSGEEVPSGGMEMLTCVACHDPHERTVPDNEHQLRVFGSVKLPEGVLVTGVGGSALCMSCHNVVEDAEVVHGEGAFYPPQSAAAEMLAGTGGYDFGETIYDSPHAHKAMWKSPCLQCHMATPPISTWAAGDAEAVAASMNRPVGGHTFRVKWDNGTPDDPRDDVENLDACAPCHGEIRQINGPAAADYDGDGKVEGVQDEVQGLLDLVKSALIASGVSWDDTPPHWGVAGTEVQRAAVYNWSFVAGDRSLGVHNLGRSVQLLQITYRHLTGHDVPGATLWAEAHDNPPYASRFRPTYPGWVLTAVGAGIVLLCVALAVLVVSLRHKVRSG